MWKGRLLSEKPPLWIGISVKSSLVSECVEKACMKRRLHVCAINVEFSLISYIFGFSHDGTRHCLTYYIHLKRK